MQILFLPKISAPANAEGWYIMDRSEEVDGPYDSQQKAEEALADMTGTQEDFEAIYRE